jgi:hypothetical protein
MVRVNGRVDEKKDQIHEDKVSLDSQSGDHGHTATALPRHKKIQHTVCYTEVSPSRFRDFRKDCQANAPRKRRQHVVILPPAAASAFSCFRLRKL